MDHIRAIRQRMTAAYEPLYQCFEVQRQTLPRLAGAVEAARQSNQTDAAQLDNIQAAVNTLLAAHNARAAEIDAAQAAIGNLREAQVDADRLTHEYAHLTTLSQYTEIAAVSSPSFIRDILLITDAATAFLPGWKMLPAERRALLLAVIAED